MTTKADYTEEEWLQLLQAPFNAGILVMVSDLGVTSMFKEMKGMLKGMIEQPAPTGAQELIGSLLEEVKQSAENKEKIEMPDTAKKDPETYMQEMLQTMSEAAALVEAKGGEDEAVGYKLWLVGVAQATAEAGKEGGFLGIGAVRVSQKEKVAIEKISRGLGL